MSETFPDPRSAFDEVFRKSLLPWPHKPIPGRKTKPSLKHVSVPRTAAKHFRRPKRKF